MPPDNARPIGLQPRGGFGNQTLHRLIHGSRRRKIARASAPAQGNAPGVKDDRQFSQITRRPPGRHHKHGRAVGRTLHHGIRAFLGIPAQTGMRMPAHNDIHARHGPRQGAIPFQSQMRQRNDMADALRLQFPDAGFQRRPRIPEPRLRARRRQLADPVVGQTDNPDPDAADCLDDIGAHTRTEQGTARLRREIGGRHGQRLRLQKGRQRVAAVVELMIAQRHGIIRHEPINGGHQGPFADAVEQRSLKLIAGIQRDDIVMRRPGLPDSGGNAAHAADARRRRKTGVTGAVGARQKGVRIVCMQDAQSSSRGAPAHGVPHAHASARTRHAIPRRIPRGVAALSATFMKNPPRNRTPGSPEPSARTTAFRLSERRRPRKKRNGPSVYKSAPMGYACTGFALPAERIFATTTKGVSLGRQSRRS